MKKLSVILLSLIICAALFGCSTNKTYVDNNQSAGSTVTAVSTTQNENTLNAEKESEATVAKSTAASDSAITTATTNSKNSGNRADSNANENKTTTQNNNTTANRQINTSSKPTTNKPTTAKQTTTSSTITCSVTIECTGVLDNMDNLKAGHEDYVPSDGYIISSYSVTIPNGSTAYDAVKTACENQGVTINVVSSSYGKYIAGFNNIDEKDCGNQSGWIYFINGSSPSKSCSKYKLSNGDNVVFSYTCS